MPNEMLAQVEASAHAWKAEGKTRSAEVGISPMSNVGLLSLESRRRFASTLTESQRFRIPQRFCCGAARERADINS